MTTIIHLTTAHPRYDARIFIKEVKTLAVSFSHNIVLMVADGKGNEKDEKSGASIYDLGRLPGGRLGRLFFGSWRSFIEIRKYKPVIIHFHDPELIPIAMLLKIVGGKVVYDIHEDLPRQILSKDWIPATFRKPIAFFMTGIETLAASIFDAIVPATPKIAARFHENKTKMIQNFPIVTEVSLTAPIPYEKRPFAFAYPGYISKYRGIHEVVQALHLIKDIEGIRLDLAGEFSPPILVEELRALPGWELVTYHGWISRERLSHLLGSARAGLVLHHPIPNEIDAQPIKLYEYMSAGLPILASDFPLLKQIIEGERCGLLVDPLDPEAIAAAMRWIIDHPVEAEAMGQRGRQAVLRVYNWDKEAAKLIDLYNKLLGT